MSLPCSWRWWTQGPFFIIALAQAERFWGNSMWRLQGGDRCLSEVEWALIAEGAHWVVDSIRDEMDEGFDPIRTTGGYFSRLPAGQRLAVVLDTLSALRDPKSKPPELTAANEGALATCIAYLESAVALEIEISAEEPEAILTDVREGLREFATERGYFDEAPPPHADSDDLNIWRDLIEELDQTLLWDNDYAMEPADSWDPTEDNYYRSDTPNPSSARLALILEDLGDLLPETER